MLQQAVGEFLPAALAIALSPFPIIGVVMLLGAPRAVPLGVAFMLGWLVGVSALVAIGVAAFADSDVADSDTSLLASWLRVLAGIALIAAAGKKWRGRPSPGDEVELPGWMNKLDGLSVPGGLVAGLLVGGANPKNIALAISGTTSMTDVGLAGSDLFVAAAIFVVLASSSVIVSVAFRTFGGQRVAPSLERVKEFMLANNVVIMVVVFAIIGAKVLGEGIKGLGR